MHKAVEHIEHIEYIAFVNQSLKKQQAEGSTLCGDT